MSIDCDVIFSEFEGLQSEVGGIDERMAQKYLKMLSSVASNNENYDSITFTKTLAKILECSPQSELLDEYLSLSIFQSLMKVCPTTDEDLVLIRSLATIFLYFLSGPFQGRKSTFISIMDHMLAGPSVLELICHKLAESDITCILLIVGILSKFLLRLFEMQNDELLTRFVAKLMEQNTFSSLCKIPVVYEDELTRNQNWKHFMKITKLVHTYLLNRTIDPDDSTHSKLISNVQIAVMHFNEGLSYEEVSEQALNSQENLGDVSNLTLLSAVHVISLFSSPGMAFKKQFTEHQLFENRMPPCSLFELAKGITSAMEPDNISHGRLISMPIQFSEELFEVLFLCSIRFWDSSKADANDLPVLLHHVTHLFDYFHYLVKVTKFEDAICSLRNIDYDTFKPIEMKKIAKDCQEWWQKNSDDYNGKIYDETIEFVKDQHLMMLSKGTWVFSENPMNPHGSSKSSSYFFIILSTNHKAILYKEFSKKPDKKPDIDKDGAKIEFSQISDITYQPLTRIIESSNLISIDSRLQVNRIDIRVKSNGLFSFYVNTIDDLYIWLDGLRMLLSDSTRLSHDTEQQINWLSSIRKQAQFLELAIEGIDQVAHDNNAFVSTEEPDLSKDMIDMNSRFYFN
ncbi:hypothetical protein KL919_000539 [Ogataea angusta]|nr:hypothetical protein KL919_000539 [Ogataea angusta]